MSHFVLVGNPNCGKSTLFNRLSGLQQKTSNLPGTTIDIFSTKIGQHYLTDLPGIYSLYAHTPEEKIVETVFKTHLNSPKIKPIDCIILVIDASKIKRGLLLYKQLEKLKLPIIIALTMNDVAKKNKMEINSNLLSKELDTIVLELNPRSGENCRLLLQQIQNYSSVIHHPPTQYQYQSNTAAEIIQQYSDIENLVKKVLKSAPREKKSITFQLDQILLHPVWGLLFFVFVMYLIFQSVFSFAQLPMDWIETGFGLLNSKLQSLYPNAIWMDFITNGLISGIAGIVTFVPQILVLYFLLGILEDSGYMTRASFVTDFYMRKLGLNGRSIIPLIGGFACAIPGIMATRTIKNPQERFATMFILPLMSCSARLPVYVLLISLFVNENEYWGIFSVAGLWMTATYFAGVFLAILVALCLKKVSHLKSKGELLMELPVYQWPRWIGILNHALLQAKSFVFQAGKIILIISILIWLLSSYGPTERMKTAHIVAEKTIRENKLNKEEAENILISLKLENSYLGIAGRTIEPVIAPLGFDWKTGIAILSSFAAREVFVGTMSTIFAQGNSSENVSSLKIKMLKEKDPITGKQKYGYAYAVSLMIFFAFAMQCMSTMAVMRKESGSWRWPILQLFLYSGLAYFLALAAFQLLK